MANSSGCVFPRTHKYPNDTGDNNTEVKLIRNEKPLLDFVYGKVFDNAINRGPVWIHL